MEKNKMFEFLKTNVKSDIKIDEPMKKHTTFKIGGMADLFINISTISDLKFCLKYFKENNVNYYVIGNGSNLLVSDNGFRGAILKIGDNFNDITVDGNFVTASAGAMLSKISNVCYENSLGGFEFAGGIPGTFGGAIAINAGAYGGEIKDVFLKGTFLDENFDVVEIDNENMDFSYRHSVTKNRNLISLSATLKLDSSNKDDIKTKLDEFKNLRVTKQPLEFPSAGSTFKRPEGYFAGKLIMDAGLRGFTVGGALVSEKHCGFVINNGTATAKDVINVINHCKTVVFDKSGVSIETEVEFLGF